MNLLGAGSGAAKGLNQVLARLLQEQVAAQRQAQIEEEIRSNKANEGLRSRQLDLSAENNQLNREAMQAHREALATSRTADDMRAALSAIPGGTDVDPQTVQTALNVGAATPERFIKSVPYGEDFVGPIAPNEPQRGQEVFQLRKTPQELATEERLSAAEEKAANIQQQNEWMRGFMSSREQRLRDAATKPIQGADGKTYYVVAAESAGQEAPRPVGLREEGFNLNDFTAQLDKIDQMIERTGGKGLGPISGSIGSFLYRKTGEDPLRGIGIDSGGEEGLQLRSAIGELRANRATLQGGKQLTAGELRLFDQFLTNATDNPKAARSFLQQLRRSVARRQSSMGWGKETPASGQTPPPQGDAYDEFMRQYFPDAAAKP